MEQKYPENWCFKLSYPLLKYALRYIKSMIKQHENIMRKDSLAKKFAMSDPTKFWSEIRMMSGHNNTLPSCVEGVSGKGRIVEQWRLH